MLLMLLTTTISNATVIRCFLFFDAATMTMMVVMVLFAERDGDDEVEINFEDSA